MGLIINQGIQDTSQDGKFDPIVSEKEMLECVKVEAHDRFDDAITLTWKIIGENSMYKGKLCWDDVTYGAESEHSWRYRQLRERVGVPYVKGEPADIDIEQILLGKIVMAELSKRPDKTDPTKFYQKTKYLKNAPTFNKPEQGGGITSDTPADFAKEINQPGVVEKPVGLSSPTVQDKPGTVEW